MTFDDQKVDQIIAESLDLPERENGMKDWEKELKPSFRSCS